MSIEKVSRKRTLALDSLEEPSSKRILPMDSLEGPSGSRVLFLDSLGGASNRTVLSPDILEGPLTRGVLSVDPLEGSSTMRVLPLDPLEGPSTMRYMSEYPSENPSTLTYSPRDTLRGHLSISYLSLNLLKRHSTSSASSLDPLESQQTRTNWYSSSAASSLTDLRTSYHSEAETNELVEPLIQQNVCWNRILAWLNSSVRRHSRRLRNSAFYPLLLLTLMVLPYSAGYMGCNNFFFCDGCRQLTVSVYLVGLLGVCAISLHIITILSQRYFSPPLTGHEFNALLVTLYFLVFMFLMIEMFTIYTCEPVFIPSKNDFCLKVFYNYTYYANLVATLVVLLLILITVPAYYDPAEISWID